MSWFFSDHYIAAAAEAADALSFPFTLTARAENFIVGRRDLDDTIKRLQAFQEAGADVLYAPGLMTRDEITAVVSSLDRPVNVLMAAKGFPFSRAALGAFLRAASETREHGTFHFVDAAGSRDISAMFKER